MADDIASLFASMTPEQRGSGLAKDLILTELARLRAADSILRKLLAVNSVKVWDAPTGPRIVAYEGPLVALDAGELAYLQQIVSEDG